MGTRGTTIERLRPITTRQDDRWRLPGDSIPHARLFGGDLPRGGNPPAHGHAGRRRLAEVAFVAASAVLVWLAVMLMWPREAHALGDSMAFYKNPVDYTMSVASYRSEDGDIAYCCNKALSHENGLTYTSWAYATGRWGYVAYHGYPTTTIIGGTQLSVGRARSATQWAVWMLNGDDVESDPYFSGASADTRAAAYSLAQAALAYERSGVDGPESHYARMYYPPSGSLQTFLMVPNAGELLLVKVSAEENLTSGNACYSLAGAVYELFSDEACTTRVASATTGSDGTASFGSVPAGTYWLREREAPQGYVLDGEAHQVEVTGGDVTTFTASDVPQTYLPGFLARKVDNDTKEPVAQGDATLSGAQFTVGFYAGSHTSVSALPQSPSREWVFGSDDKGEVSFDKAHLVSGTLPTRSDGSVALPLGTLWIRETKAPTGYTLPTGDGWIVQLPSSGKAATLDLPTAKTVDEQVMRGGVKIGKVDAETLLATPLGMARLDGAEVSVYNASDGAVVVDGVSYGVGEVVTTLVTDAEGIAQTASDLLPYGTYELRETKAPDGYLLNERWSRKVTIDASGKVWDLTGKEEMLANQVKRGDFSFGKVDGQTMRRLPNVPFRVTLLEDAWGNAIGESHVIVTDENGMFDSSSEVTPHSADTNANDAAVDNGRVDASQLKPDSGIWFSGRNDLTTLPDDVRGALPYGTYLLEELRSDANVGHGLVRVRFVVKTDGRHLDLGTIDDNPLTISTTLARIEDDTDDDEQHGLGGLADERQGLEGAAEGTDDTIEPSGMVTLVDTVCYEGLSTGSSYLMRGTLHLRGVAGDDQGELLAQDGTPVTGETSFVPTGGSGTVEVRFELDASKLEGATVVAFEECLEDGLVVARHADITSQSQSVRFAGIRTTATDAEDGDHIIAPVADAMITDTVSYQGLVPGTTYTLEARVHVRDEDGHDTGELLDSDGNPVTGEATFSPTDSSGTVEVPIDIDAHDLGGSTLVVFERLLCDGDQVAHHEDIDDEGQTVYVAEPEPEPEPEPESAPQSPKRDSETTPPAPTHPAGGSTPGTGDGTNSRRPLSIFLAGIAALGAAAAASTLGRPRLAVSSRGCSSPRSGNYLPRIGRPLSRRKSSFPHHSSIRELTRLLRLT